MPGSEQEKETNTNNKGIETNTNNKNIKHNEKTDDFSHAVLPSWVFSRQVPRNGRRSWERLPV